MEAWRHEDGRFRYRVAPGVDLEFGPADRERLEALLLALADAKRALTGDEFVPGKALALPRRDAGEMVVRIEPEDVDWLRARVRVGKESSLDSAVSRAVKAYMRDLLRRTDPDEPARPRAPRLGQRTLPEPSGLAGVGVIQRGLLQLAARRGHVSRLDVGRAYGLTATRRNASSARTKADAALAALVARNLLAPRVVDGETHWMLTETGRALVETDLQG